MIGYNETWVKSVTFEEFVKHQSHHKDNTDLKADYERITGKKVDKEKKKEVE